MSLGGNKTYAFPPLCLEARTESLRGVRIYRIARWGIYSVVFDLEVVRAKLANHIIHIEIRTEIGNWFTLWQCLCVEILRYLDQSAGLGPVSLALSCVWFGYFGGAARQSLGREISKLSFLRVVDRFHLFIQYCFFVSLVLFIALVLRALAT